VTSAAALLVLLGAPACRESPAAVPARNMRQAPVRSLKCAGLTCSEMEATVM
jgi:hypothetical protein